MKKYLPIVLLVAAAVAGWAGLDAGDRVRGPPVPGDEVIAEAFRSQATDLQVTGQGVVTRILPDDNDGSRHQRFILRLASGQTLLVAHNIDLAPRIRSLRVGDSVTFNLKSAVDPARALTPASRPHLRPETELKSV